MCLEFQKEKKTLESKRLDLDSCKSKLKKLKDEKYKPEVSLTMSFPSTYVDWYHEMKFRVDLIFEIFLIVRLIDFIALFLSLSLSFKYVEFDSDLFLFFSISTEMSFLRLSN